MAFWTLGARLRQAPFPHCSVVNQPMLIADGGGDGIASDCLTSPGFRLAPCAKMLRRATMRRRRMFFMVEVMVRFCDDVW
jgi:hypothetical protein